MLSAINSCTRGETIKGIEHDGNIFHKNLSFDTACTTGAPVAQLVEGCHAGGREFDSGRTNTQGLKITEKKVLLL